MNVNACSRWMATHPWSRDAWTGRRRKTPTNRSRADVARAQLRGRAARVRLNEGTISPGRPRDFYQVKREHITRVARREPARHAKIKGRFRALDDIARRRSR